MLTDLVEVDDVDDPVAQVGRRGRLGLHHGVREIRLQEERLHSLDDLLRRFRVNREFFLRVRLDVHTLYRRMRGM